MVEGGIVAKGQRFAAIEAAQFVPGTRVRAFVRPEDVVVGSPAGGHPEAVEATVVSVEYLGPIARVLLQTGGPTIEADVSPTLLHRDAIAEGARLPMLAARDRILMFATDA